MNADETTIDQLIAGTKQYIIPVFQRDYEWGRERWKILWDDILSVFDDFELNLTHFIGPIVVVSKALPYEYPLHLVIDGQQRLVTTFIILAAIRDRARTLGLGSLARSVQTNSLTFLHTDGRLIYKLRPRIRDRETLNRILDGKTDDIDVNSLLTESYHYFLDEIRRLTPDQPSLFENDSPEKTLPRLYHTITQRLIAVTITLGNNDNPSNIFESLNFKQELLADSDLIRNYIFMQIPVDKQDEFHNAEWKSFEDMFNDLPYDDKEKKKVLTDFFYRYLITRTHYFPRKILYSQFTEYVNELFRKGTTPTQLVNELKQFGHYFLVITQSGFADSELEESLERFRRLDTPTAVSLVLAIYERYDKGEKSDRRITASTFLAMLQIIESFILRRAITRENTRNYGEDFALAIAHIDSVNSLIRYFDSKGWPTDERIIDALREFPIYHREPKKTAIILREIERSFGHKEEVHLEKTTVEHVMPRNLTFEWRAMIGPRADEVHERLLDTIGNLTLTGYNVEMGAKPYQDKREYYLQSKIELNNYFRNHDKWGEDEILARSRVLAEQLTKIWIRPESTSPQRMAKGGAGEDEAKPIPNRLF